MNKEELHRLITESIQEVISSPSFEYIADLEGFPKRGDKDFVHKAQLLIDEKLEKVQYLYNKVLDPNYVRGIYFERLKSEGIFDKAVKIANYFNEEIMNLVKSAKLTGAPKTYKELLQYNHNMIEIGKRITELHRVQEQQIQTYKQEKGDALDASSESGNKELNQKCYLEFVIADCMENIINDKYYQIEQLFEASGSYYRSFIEIMKYLDS